MKLPKQAPAVERKINRLAAVPPGAKVRPAGWLDDLERGIGIATRVAGTAGPLIGAL